MGKHVISVETPFSPRFGHGYRLRLQVTQAVIERHRAPDRYHDASPDVVHHDAVRRRLHVIAELSIDDLAVWMESRNTKKRRLVDPQPVVSTNRYSHSVIAINDIVRTSPLTGPSSSCSLVRRRRSRTCAEELSRPIYHHPKILKQCPLADQASYTAICHRQYYQLPLRCLLTQPLVDDSSRRRTQLSAEYLPRSISRLSSRPSPAESDNVSHPLLPIESAPGPSQSFDVIPSEMSGQEDALDSQRLFALSLRVLWKAWARRVQLKHRRSHTPQHGRSKIYRYLHPESLTIFR